jgi:hypothetical protein
LNYNITRLIVAADERLKTNFESMTLPNPFWIKVLNKYTELSEIALVSLLPFLSAYVCKIDHFVMDGINTKH